MVESTDLVTEASSAMVKSWARSLKKWGDETAFQEEELQE